MICSFSALQGFQQFCHFCCPVCCQSVLPLESSRVFWAAWPSPYKLPGGMEARYSKQFWALLRHLHNIQLHHAYTLSHPQVCLNYLKYLFNIVKNIIAITLIRIANDFSKSIIYLCWIRFYLMIERVMYAFNNFRNMDFAFSWIKRVWYTFSTSPNRFLIWSYILKKCSEFV